MVGGADTRAPAARPSTSLGILRGILRLSKDNFLSTAGNVSKPGPTGGKMPTYEYKCEACKKKSEVRQSMTAKPLTKCPKCGGKLTRLIGGGGGFIFKGSGFYATDHRSDSYKKSEAKEKKPETPSKESKDKS